MSAAVERLAGALAGLAGAPVELDRPSDPAHGDYATNVALRLAKQEGRPPREVAARIVAELDLGDLCEPLEIAETWTAKFKPSPGFMGLIRQRKKD